MRTFLAMGLLFSVSIPVLLVGSGCTVTVTPDSDRAAGSPDVEGAEPDPGTGAEPDPGTGAEPDPGTGAGERPTPEDDGRPAPPPSTACWLGEMGDGFTCHDASALRDHAQARCARMGAELASFLSDTLNPSCAEHETSQVFFECCGAEPPPPPPPGACWKGELGDGSSCIDLSALKDRAYAMCDSANAVLATFDYRQDPWRCGDNAAIMAHFECCGAEPPPPPPPGACWGGELGDGSSCIDLSALKERAYATCDSANAVLTRLDYKQDPWRCGDNAAIIAYFECCGAEPPPPPPPPPPPGACFKGELGDGRSCLDPSALKDRAYATCVSAGANLTVFDYERGASHCAPYETTRAYFECCGTPPPPPPPPGACFKGELGDGRSCLDPSALKDRAYATCVSAGANLTVFDYERGASHCAPYETTRAVFECCGTPPPPPPERCWGGDLGGGSSCIDVSALKERAYAMCASDNAQLTAFDYANDGRCAEHEATHAKFACCASTAPPPR